MKLIITEKPSVAQAIGNYLNCKEKRNGYIHGNDYDITWCFGHLLGLVNAADYDEKYKKWNINDLPIIPGNFRLKPNKSTLQQYKIVKELLNDTRYESVLCGTDAGREGELIFRQIYNASKSKLPIQRLWFNSNNDDGIKKAFDNLKPGKEFDNLYYSAFAREKADWLVGINLTRYYTCKNNKKLVVGRCQTPTLKMIVDRYNEVKEFKKNYFYKLHINYKDIDFVYENDVEEKEEINDLYNLCLNKKAKVISITKKEERIKPKKLYSLLTLQVDSNKLYKYSANKTLEIMQSLYDKKLVTYPRTDSNYINDSMIDEVTNLVNKILELKFNNLDYKYSVKQVADDSKVTDHHAIIPTKEGIKNKDNLSVDENNILNLIINRTVIAVGLPMVFEKTDCIIDVENNIFKATHKQLKNQGFNIIEKRKIEEEKNSYLINLSEESFYCNNLEVSEHETKPKQLYTDGTLLAALEIAGKKELNKIDGVERVGIGTAATRSTLIEKLLKDNYITREKNRLIPTPEGIELINLVDDKLKSVDLTIDFETRLSNIKLAKENENKFIEDIGKFVDELCKDKVVKNVNKKIEIKGTCPLCGKGLIEKQSKFGKFVACSNYPECIYIEKNNKETKYTYKGTCPECGNNLVERTGKYGKFISCINYPKCKYVKK